MLLYERTRNGFCLTFLRDPTKEIDCDIHRQRDFLVSRLWFRLASLGRAARLDRLRVAILSIALDIRVDLSALQHRTTSTLNFPFGAVLDRRRRQFLVAIGINRNNFRLRRSISGSRLDRKRVGSGRSVPGREDLGGTRRINKKKNN